MLAKALSYGVNGVDGYPVYAEVFISGGLPSLDIVGLPDTAVKESRDRVRAAIMNTGFAMPISRVTVNLSPADIKKEGPSYDLPIAVAVLVANNQVIPESPEDTVLFGELSLDGTLQPVKGALPMVISARQEGMKSVILPKQNAREVITVQGISVYPAETLREVIYHLTGREKLPRQQQKSYQECLDNTVFPVDMADVRGQVGAKRAVEVACAGGHNLIMIGVPGAGKTMLARCIPTILPPMTYQEALETTRIHSITGALRGQGMLTLRPFRSPHHSASVPSLVGGGSKAGPGEVSLAHNGVLFLDELAEFTKQALEALRQPLEDGVASVTRVSAKMNYPSRCMLVASMNPCPCGYHGSKTKKCRCSSHDIRRYLDRISGPLLDRVDIQIEVDSVPVEEIRHTGTAESSADILKRVQAARERQLQRFAKEGIHSNAQMDAKQVKRYCVLDTGAEPLLTMAVRSNHISMRGYTRILKVARTITDLRGGDVIGSNDIAEAIQYRSLDQKYWSS
ncbi:MAG: YifB family Mg chelatase-like AAA ATPase [Clostridia bacterium]|nr:YifB family Mg chelatase-like AAA ATPase [Clostridia bacterium]